MSYFRRPEQKHNLRLRENIDNLVASKIDYATPFHRAKLNIERNVFEE